MRCSVKSLGRRVATLVAASLLGGCSAQAAVPLVPEVLATYPHDPEAFTQGLLWDGGRLFESTGLYGASTLREVVPETGEVVRLVALDARYFGEGLALVGDRLIQLTWQEGTAFVYDRATFERVGTFSYEGEGWGLCFDGEALYMSDGSATLTRRDPETFEVLETVEVTLRGEPVALLNELECAKGRVYANVFTTDVIVRIDPASGRVQGVVDASALLSAEERARLTRDAVLNGIAYNPEADTFYLTGKLWPKLFEVRFVAP
ncbi:glutaminyl-peptide cyclotransferase [Truepera radiovictrix]|uniref:Glutamine cyclotransferase n=1 Tax=Truepera radiovictrix (strain DSM 17093 / CIP 108686 / LMG 22925 / RQ-24) TaxID=649638 RepID=D7CSU4_TRURR|nr:glutaminyl-peptide cyclotransferase [Truepera radiovictrix]ADI13711.1 glutamine cyclotransferase [Truepera radiovictrix DSM 17093]WMT57724.1 glutaminyl-peptide cyclotransferase [Truepera radiovictrix]